GGVIIKLWAALRISRDRQQPRTRTTYVIVSDLVDRTRVTNAAAKLQDDATRTLILTNGGTALLGYVG
ncbi:hypothetical protein, partial [Natronococcus jeotgali]